MSNDNTLLILAKMERTIAFLGLMSLEYSYNTVLDRDREVKNRFNTYRSSMSNAPKFKPTHRMLVKATTEHNYEAVDIDTNNGTFKKITVKMTETKIRVNKSILGENLITGKAISNLDEIKMIAEGFNAVRVAAGYVALNFRLTEEVKREVSDNQVQ
jgi:hypothetical protein